MQHHICTIKNSQVILEDKDRFKRAVANLPEKEYILCLIPTENKDANEYRAWYYAMMSVVSMHSGYTKDELHVMVKEKVLPLLNVTSTKDLNTPGKWKRFFLQLSIWVLKEFDCLI